MDRPDISSSSSSAPCALLAAAVPPLAEVAPAPPPKRFPGPEMEVMETSSDEEAAPVPAPAPKVAPKAASFRCPFPHGELAQKSLAKGKLVSHLAATHVSGGQQPPLDTLVALGLWCCLACRSLFRLGAPCRCKAALQEPQVVAQQAPGHLRQPSAAAAAASAAAVAASLPAGTPLSGPAPVLQPSFESILGTHVPTLRHIPAACRAPVASVLASLVRQVQVSATWRSLQALVLFRSVC